MAADGTQPYIRPRPPVPAALVQRQALSRELYGWESEFRRAIREQSAATPDEIEGAIADLTETGEQIAAFVRDFQTKFAGSIAAGPSFGISTAYLADLLADTIADGLTQDASRVLVAAVKRECA